jgi:hypothetical protein
MLIARFEHFYAQSGRETGQKRKAYLVRPGINDLHILVYESFHPLPRVFSCNVAWFRDAIYARLQVLGTRVLDKPGIIADGMTRQTQTMLMRFRRDHAPKANRCLFFL